MEIYANHRIRKLKRRVPTPYGMPYGIVPPITLFLFIRYVCLMSLPTGDEFFRFGQKSLYSIVVS